MLQSRMRPPRPRPREQSVGALLQFWRSRRQRSQLTLASEAGVSPRHLCFIETGRANPSREMVLHLANVLDVPLRSRNALLLAAGFAPAFAESNLAAPELAAVRDALSALLAQQEPFPAVVMNRRWDILQTNRSAQRFFDHLLAGRSAPQPANVLRMMLHPQGLRGQIANWSELGETLIQRAHREAVGGVPDEALNEILEEVYRYPGVSRAWRGRDPSASLLPVLPVVFQTQTQTFRFFSALTTLGTPQDVTVQELRIESFFPLDDSTRRAIMQLAG